MPKVWRRAFLLNKNKGDQTNEQYICRQNLNDHRRHRFLRERCPGPVLKNGY